jgi:hypothetical protein
MTTESPLQPQKSLLHTNTADFRHFDDQTNRNIYQHYTSMRTYQTVEYGRQMRKKYLTFSHPLHVWDAIVCFSINLILCLTLSLSLSHSLTLSLSHSITLTLSLSHSLTLSLTHTECPRRTSRHK